MITIDDTHTSANVIIVDSICANFILQAIFFQGMIMIIIFQAKVVSYCDQHLENDFILVTIEIFECLH